MKCFFLSRKTQTDIGGLARFSGELSRRLPKANLIKCDIIYLSDATLLPLGVMLKFLSSKPLVMTAHGKDITWPNRFYQFLLKLLMPQVEAIILDSRQAKKLLQRFNLKNTKIRVITPGISVTHLKGSAGSAEESSLDTEFRRHFPILGDSVCIETALKTKIVLLTVGNLVPRKGHTWFIEKVMSGLPGEYIYFIVGEGEEKTRILKLLKSLRLENRVFLLGRLTDRQLSFIYKKADIYVCPNVQKSGDFEGFGIAVGEAAGMGLPVVASKVDGISSVIQHGKNGWLVQPDEDKFLKLLKSLKNKKLRKKMGKKARVFTRKNYSWRKTTRDYLSLFEEVIGKN